jgi:hypothetical protein
VCAFFNNLKASVNNNAQMSLLNNHINAMANDDADKDQCYLNDTHFSQKKRINK